MNSSIISKNRKYILDEFIYISLYWTHVPGRKGDRCKKNKKKQVYKLDTKHYMNSSIISKNRKYILDEFIYISLYWGDKFSNFQKLVSQTFPFTPK